MGAYVPPNDSPGVHCVQQALIVAPTLLELILMGNLNARLGDPRDKREEDLATSLSDRGLINITVYFLPRRR